MRVSTMIRIDPDVKPHDQVMSRVADYAGASGRWVPGYLGGRFPRARAVNAGSAH